MVTDIYYVMSSVCKHLELYSMENVTILPKSSATIRTGLSLKPNSKIEFHIAKPPSKKFGKKTLILKYPELSDSNEIGVVVTNMGISPLEIKANYIIAMLIPEKTKIGISDIFRQGRHFGDILGKPIYKTIPKKEIGEIDIDIIKKKFIKVLREKRPCRLQYSLVEEISEEFSKILLGHIKC